MLKTKKQLSQKENVPNNVENVENTKEKTPCSDIFESEDIDESDNVSEDNPAPNPVGGPAKRLFEDPATKPIEKEASKSIENQAPKSVQDPVKQSIENPARKPVEALVPVVKFGSRSSNEVRKPPRSMSQKAGLEFPVFKILRRLKKDRYAKKIQKGAAVYMSGILEYLAAEALDIASITAAAKKKKRIIPRHLMLALRNDPDLGELVKDVVISESGVVPNIYQVLLPKKIDKSSSKSNKKKSRK